MAASYGSVYQVADILEEHLEPAKLDAVLKDLSGTRGNASFTETVRRIKEEIERRKQNHAHDSQS